MKNLRGFLAFALLLLAIPSFAAVDAFIWFDKVKGESTDPAHNGWVEVSSFSWGMGNRLASAAAQGCATNEIRFTARGSAAPQLVKLTAGGANFAPVKLDVGGQQHVLDGATLTSCQNNLNVNGDGKPAVNCVMRFQRCETHSNAVNTASLVNRGLQTDTQSNGKFSLGDGTMGWDVRYASITPAGPNQVNVVLRGASPALMRACATGQHYKTAILHCRKAGGNQQEYLNVTMSEVLISSYSRNADGTMSVGLKYGFADGSFAGYQDIH